MATAQQRLSRKTKYNNQRRTEYIVKPLPKTDLKVKPEKLTELTNCVVLGYN